MKLEILLKYYNIIWPEGATHAVQDEDGWIKFATNPNMKLLPNGCWERGLCPQAKDYPVYNIPLASDWDTAIVAKQNWVQITKEQIKSIPEGSPIRVDGTETILTYHYKAPTDYGFNTEHEIQKLGGSTFGSSDWNKNIKVEVLMGQGHPHAEQMLQYAQDFRETKIKILSEEHSRAFQEAVFAAGGGWLTGGKVILPDAVHIYVDENLILTAASNLRYFESHDCREIVFPHPAKGHPHAELMAQFAEDAKTTDKPWDLYQIKTVQNTWKDIGCQFIFDSDCTYRRKPKTKLVHGVEVPDISFTPEDNEYYFYPNPSTDGFCHQTRYAPMSSGDIHRVKHGLCYPYTEEGKQAAILHSKAMLGIVT